MRNKGKTLHGKMALALEKFKEHPAEFIHAAVLWFFHFIFLHIITS